MYCLACNLWAKKDCWEDPESQAERAKISSASFNTLEDPPKI
jgi:hypothetical protein